MAGACQGVLKCFWNVVIWVLGLLSLSPRQLSVWLLIVDVLFKFCHWTCLASLVAKFLQVLNLMKVRASLKGLHLGYARVPEMAGGR